MHYLAQKFCVSQECIEGPLRGSNIIGKNVQNLGDLINLILAFVYPAAGIILLYLFLWSGYDFLFSAGNPERVGKAKGRLINALIGIAILISAFVITRIASTVFRLGPGILP